MPAPQPSTALRRDIPYCVLGHFLQGRAGHFLDLASPFGVDNSLPAGGKALQSALVRTITITCPCPSLINVWVTASACMVLRSRQVTQHWGASSAWLLPFLAQHSVKFWSCACKEEARSLPGSWLKAVLETSSSSTAPYHLKKKLPSAKLFSNPPHAIHW